MTGSTRPGTSPFTCSPRDLTTLAAPVLYQNYHAPQSVVANPFQTATVSTPSPFASESAFSFPTSPDLKAAPASSNSGPPRPASTSSLTDIPPVSSSQGQYTYIQFNQAPKAVAGAPPITPRRSSAHPSSEASSGTLLPQTTRSVLCTSISFVTAAMSRQSSVPAMPTVPEAPPRVVARPNTALAKVMSKQAHMHLFTDHAGEL